MISEGIKIIRLILEAKFGDDPLTPINMPYRSGLCNDPKNMVWWELHDLRQEFDSSAL